MHAIEEASDVFPECQPVLEVHDVQQAGDDDLLSADLRDKKIAGLGHLLGSSDCYPVAVPDSLQFTLVVIGAVLITLIISLSQRRRTEEPITNDSPGTDGDAGEEAAFNVQSPTANKDKAVASVLVDMRMNDPSRHDVLLQRASETDASLTETEGSQQEGFPPTIADLSMAVDISASEDIDQDNSSGLWFRRRRHRL